VEAVENPSHQELLASMRVVDVAVQLRIPDHGEASGVVRQLIGCGKCPIVSRGLFDPELDGAVEVVRDTVSPSELASMIVQTAGSVPSREAVEKLSVARFSERFLSVLNLAG
jgi:hypothetical protein